MNTTVQELRAWAEHCPDRQKVLEAAAARIEALESSSDHLRDIHNLTVENKRLNDELDRLRNECHRMHDDICREQQKNKPYKEQLEQANEIIAKIAKAAECDNFADIILARVEAQTQQCNAMVRICEGHIATARRETAEANDYLDANKKLSTRIDELNNQDNQKRHMLHRIADELGAGSRNALPAQDWYLEEIRKLKLKFIGPTLKGEVTDLVQRHEGYLGLKEDKGCHIVGRLAAVLGVYSDINVQHRKYLDFAAVVKESITRDDVNIETLGDKFRGLDIALLKAKAADYDNLNIESLKKSQDQLINVATQIHNWQERSGTYVCDSVKDPDWAKQANAMFGLMERRLNDAAHDNQGLTGQVANLTQANDAKTVTLHQLANALGVSPMEEGWHTKMLNKAENLMSTVNSKEFKWDRQKTEALQALLQYFNLWPGHNNVDGLQKLKLHIEHMQLELDDLKKRIIEKNNHISELEHSPGVAHLRNLEQTRAMFERIKRRIEAANECWGIKVADTEDYDRQLSYLLGEAQTWRDRADNLSDDLVGAQKGAAIARNELALANGSIKRMHANLLKNKDLTGIWPSDNTIRAKLDDIEWCLNIYVSRFNEAQFQRNADTQFIAAVRDSLSHEILRRNKQ